MNALTKAEPRPPAKSPGGLVRAVLDAERKALAPWHGAQQALADYSSIAKSVRCTRRIATKLATNERERARRDLCRCAGSRRNTYAVQ
jgi:hypothetical protein